MAVTFVKKASGQSGTASTSLTLTMASAPAAGNLLVFTMGGDKNTGALTLAGFTQVHSLLSTSVSLYLAWKVSDGTETAITPSWATSSAVGNVAWYGEFSDPVVTGASSWQVSASAEHITDETNVTSWSTGTTGAASAAGLGLAQITMDSADSVVDATEAWTNSYTILFSTLASAGARGALFLASAPVLSGATAESTFSYTPSVTLRDQLSGSMTVFSKVPAPSTSVTTDAPAATGTSGDATALLSVGTDAPAATGTAQGAAVTLSAGAAAPGATGSAFDAAGAVAVAAPAAAPAAAGSAWDAVGGITGQPDTVQAAGEAYSASAVTMVPVNAPAGAASATGAAYDVSTGRPQTVIRQRASGREPSGRAAGYQPVSSWAGREPPSRFEGSEAGS
jgi:hypothetical protein